MGRELGVFMTNDESVTASSQMWEKLGHQLANAVPDFVIADNPQRALQYAMCADICFWQSTGEADSFGFKEIMAILQPLTPTNP